MIAPCLSSAARRCLLPLVVLLALAAAGCNQPAAPPPSQSYQQPPAAPSPAVPPETPATTAKLPDWSANEAEAASLADPYQIASYQLRPPAEFRFIKHIPASNTWYWAGPARADETYPQLLVTIHKLPPGQENASLAQCLLDTISGIKKHRTDWNQTPAEEGLIHGLRFIRSSWSGTAAAGARAGLAGRTMHGVVYLAVHEGQAIQIMCQDVAPEHDPWLKLGAATAATFQAASADAAAP